MTNTETLIATAISISTKIAPNTVVCEFSNEDNTPTLHIDLWRGFGLSDLPAKVAELKVVAEGHWDGGRSYSFQIA